MQRYPTPEEWAKHGYEEEDFVNVMHKTEVTTLEVNANRLGETSYSFYVTDPCNLKEPIAFSVLVQPDGTLKFFQKEDPEWELETRTTMEQAWRHYVEEEIILELTGDRQLSTEGRMALGEQVLDALHARGVIPTAQYEKERESLLAWIEYEKEELRKRKEQ